MSTPPNQAVNNAYAERASLVALLAAIHYKSFRWGNDPQDSEYVIVFFDLPNGTQVSWHIHTNDLHEFQPLMNEGNLVLADKHWDGHSTAEKYADIRDFVQDLLKNGNPSRTIRYLTEIVEEANS